jgi:hypothetical protein
VLARVGKTRPPFAFLDSISDRRNQWDSKALRNLERFPRKSWLRNRRGMRNEVAIARSITVMATLGVIAALYFAKAVFLPLALAILLTFLLAPVVRLLRSWGLPKPPAVALVVTFAFIVILGIGALVGQQVTKLAQNLPLYQYNIEEKIRSARGFAGGGMLERISTFLGDINQEVRKKNDTPPQDAAPQPNEERPKPIPVEVHQPGATPMQVVQRVLQPLVDPLTTAGRAGHSQQRHRSSWSDPPTTMGLA